MKVDPRVVVVLPAVHQFHPREERGTRAQASILTALQTTPEPFSETATTTHVTGSAVVLSSAGTLLHLHKRMPIWVGPGGHVEDGEFPWEAAIRETLEETGLAVSHPEGEPTLVHLDVHESAKGHVHMDFRYVLISPSLDFAPPEGESQVMQWCADDDALAKTDEAFRPALHEAYRLRDAGSIVIS